MASPALKADVCQSFPWPRRFRSNLAYLRRPFERFLPLLGILVGVLLVGGISFQQLYEHESLSFGRALYITYCLIFMEHLLPFPEHWVLRIFYIVLPPLGLAVILDGIVRFSYHLLRRDEKDPRWITAVAKTMNNHVLVGLGKLGLRVLQELRRLDEQVLVLERDPQCPNLVLAHDLNVPVYIGSSRDEGVFDKLNFARAKSIILATNDDLANLEMALDARKIKPDITVVLRMFDPELADKIGDAFDLSLAFSTSEIAAPVFATSSSDRSIINSFYVEDELLVVARLTVREESALVQKPVRELGAGEHIFVLAYERDGSTETFPHSNVTFHAGDEITVQTKPEVLRHLHVLNKDPEPS
jgi:voltage-gated potassium channel